jgi:uncharacterized protein YaiL (DUF2058 family)
VKQDLREKLLRSGLVDKKAKKRADHRARLKRTEDQKKGVDPDAVLEQKEREYEETEEKRRRQDRKRELARHQEQLERERNLAAQRARKEAEELKDSERIHKKRRARDLLQASMFLPRVPGPVPLHFVSRSGGIRKLQVGTRLAHDLYLGRLAIVQLPGAGSERFGLVRRDVAERLIEEDPVLVRFFVADPEEEMVPTPPIAEDQPKKGRGGVRRFGPAERGKGDRREG